MIKALSFFIFSILLFKNADADNNFLKPKASSKSPCPDMLRQKGPQPPVYLTSGQIGGELHPLVRAGLERRFGKDGYIKKLGIAVPDWMMEMVTSGELALLAVIGHHALPHEIDGGTLVNNSGDVAGVLEFVTAGCPTCRAFFRDTLPPEEILSIVDHVVGHLHYGVVSHRERALYVDSIHESLMLAKKMLRWKELYGEEPVSAFYYQLKTLQQGQDYTQSNFEDPETFKKSETGIMGQLFTKRAPVNPTRSILQYFVHNLPPGTPSWKIEMIHDFERMSRAVLSIVSNKIMNEGWATFLQDLLRKHDPGLTDRIDFKIAELLPGVAYPQLSNPYWLGREAWRRIYINFRKTQNTKGRTELEIDHDFILYAEKNYIEQLSDADALRLALDQSWIHKNKFVLTKELGQGQWDQNLPGQTQKDNWQHHVVTTDYQKVRNKIVSMVADKTRFYADISLVDDSAFSRGAMYYRHKIHHGLPLHKAAAGQTLYQLSQISQKPVILDGWFAMKFAKLPEQMNLFGSQMPRWPPDWPFKGAQNLELFFARIEVRPNGDVSVQLKTDETGSTNLENKKAEESLARSLQSAIEDYRYDLSTLVLDKVYEEGNERFGRFTTQAVDSGIKGGFEMSMHAPTAAHAIMAYSRKVEENILRQTRLALEGKIKSRRTAAGGLRVRILPSTPWFQLDRAAASKIAQQKKKYTVVNWEAVKSIFTKSPVAEIPLHILGLDQAGPHAHQHEHQQQTRVVAQNNLMFRGLTKTETEDDGELGQSNGSEGDKYWAPGGPQKNNGGPSEGEEDGDQGEEADGEGDNPAKGTKPGGPGDTGVIEIPESVLADFLNERYKIPNLRPKAGPSQSDLRVREGAMTGSHREILWARMMGKILSLGKLKLEEAGILDSTLNEQFKEGLKYTPEDDYKVSDKQPIKAPDKNVEIIIVIDMSGSMYAAFPVLRDVIRNMRLIFKKEYQEVKIRIVGFSGSATELPEKTWDKSFMGGGTEYAEGLGLAQKISHETPDSKVDKVLVLAGDFEDYSDERSLPLLEEMKPRMRYLAGILAKSPWGTSFQTKLLNFFAEGHRDDPFIGYSEFTGQEASPSKSVMDQLFLPKEK